MSLPSIETLGGQAVEPFSRQPARSEVVEQVREIVEQMVGRLNAHRHLDTEAPARAAAPGLGVSAAVATQLMLSVPTPSRHGLSATGSSMLLDPDLPLLDSLSADSVAGDKEYNAREVVFRERLDLQALESRLSESAAAVGIEFHESDLDGVLRNAGYDSAHLGSSERYTVAIEKFMHEAEHRYLLRSNNATDSNA